MPHQGETDTIPAPRILISLKPHAAHETSCTRRRPPQPLNLHLYFSSNETYARVANHRVCHLIAAHGALTPSKAFSVPCSTIRSEQKQHGRSIYRQALYTKKEKTYVQQGKEGNESRQMDLLLTVAFEAARSCHMAVPSHEVASFHPAGGGRCWVCRRTSFLFRKMKKLDSAGCRLLRIPTGCCLTFFYR